jgi:tRNA (adenine22-N1)-methyltransferase
VSHDLARRLDAIASLVPHGARVADVGTDRALLPRALLATGRASYCLAIDKSPRVIRAARLALAGFDGPLELRCGSGLAAIEERDRIDVLVLAGLGARTIVRILDDPRRRVLRPSRLVLQPQSEVERLRGWLAAEGLELVDQRLAVERGRRYLVLAARGFSAQRSRARPPSTADAPCYTRPE